MGKYSFFRDKLSMMSSPKQFITSSASLKDRSAQAKIDFDGSQSVRDSKIGRAARFDFESKRQSLRDANDIIPMFKSLAGNGLFSDKKLNSAQQLRALNMM